MISEQRYAELSHHFDRLAEPISDWPRYTPPAPAPPRKVLAVHGPSMTVEWGEPVQPKRRTHRTKPSRMQYIRGWFR